MTAFSSIGRSSRGATTYRLPLFLLNAATGLVLLGVALAVLHAWQGVTTDEAKYLLNIPYPHPPLLRWIIGLTFWLPGQAIVWRVVFSTGLLLAAGLTGSLAPDGEQRVSLLLKGLWLLSAAVFVTAGQLLLAPVTAVQMLVFCRWYLMREDQKTGWGEDRMAGWMALFWMAALFTAYQALLFLPVVGVVFWRLRLPLWKRLVAFLAPVFLLVLYTSTNPLAVASMVTAGGQNMGGGSLLDAATGVVWLWLVGGSAVLSVLGLAGMVATRRWALIASVALVAGFIFLSFRPYYAILFTPLLITGVALSPAIGKRAGTVLLLCLLCALLFVPITFPTSGPSPVPAVYRAAIAADVPAGATAVIAGSFGHEWQYGPYEVHRMVGNPHLLDAARVAVCLSDCPDIRGRAGWKALPGVPVETWVRPLR